ncbi:MAG: hypothetical protein IH840_06575, partial [Candidatus Heimdallarchaeota archaeon]|nr:hypothetical protein [Candidatus Heimdallarchaeota archaeon]
MIDNDDKSSSADQYFNMSTSFEKDTSPEGEFEAVRLSQARSSLFLDMPFFGYILGNLEIYPVKSDKIGTYACDTRRIYIKAEHTSTLTKESLKGMLMHLVVHLIMQHGKRGMSKNKDLWGLSADISTRLIVEEALRKISPEVNRWTRPSDSYKEDETKMWDIDPTEPIPPFLKDQSADQVYTNLDKYANSLKGIENDPEEIEKRKNDKSKIEWRSNIDPIVMDEIQGYTGIDWPCGFGIAMDTMFGDDLDGDNTLKQLEENRFKGILRNGLSHNKKRGNLPGAISEVIDDLLDPKVPWYFILAQYIQNSLINDWKWIPPNKRLIGHGFHLPSTQRENLDVVVAVDTSGSISLTELRDFTSEAHSILSSVSGVKMILIDCDVKVQQVLTIED